LQERLQLFPVVRSPARKPGWHGDEFPDNCQFGNDAFNPDDAAFTCNDKLLAAR
jgi:hypothetical protein